MKGSRCRSIALVTGATSGLGLSSAIELARAGFRVYAGARNPVRKSAVVAAAGRHGLSLTPVDLDVCDAESVRAAVHAIEAEAGAVEVLVNNAAVAVDGFFEDLSDAELREQFETNFFGAANVTRAVLPGMRRRRLGRIISVSSISARFGRPGISAYCSSKWALEGMCESLHYELEPFGIFVVLVQPGVFKSDLHTRNRKVAERAQLPSSPYFDGVRRMDRAIEDFVRQPGEDASASARVVCRAATARAPRLRYVVGWDARRKALARALLPDSLFAAALRRWA